MTSVLLLCLTFVSGSKSWHHDVCHSVSVVTSLSYTVDEGLHAMVWWKGLEAPVEDNWWACLPHVLCWGQQGLWWHRSSVLSEAVTHFAAVEAAGAQHPILVLSTQLVADLDLSRFAEKHYGCPVASLPLWKTKSCSCLSLLFCSAPSLPPSPFPVLLKPATMRDTHSEVFLLVLMVYCDGVTCTAVEVWNDNTAGIGYVMSK